MSLGLLPRGLSAQIHRLTPFVQLWSKKNQEKMCGSRGTDIMIKKNHADREEGSQGLISCIRCTKAMLKKALKTKMRPIYNHLDKKVAFVRIVHKVLHI